MNLKTFLFVLFTALLFGCKSAPLPFQEEELGPLVLSDDEIKIINEVNEHVIKTIMRELKNSREDMQACIDNEFYFYRAKSPDSYEEDLKNAEKFLKNMSIDNEMLLSFATRNAKKRNADKDVKFKADFFWKGDKPKKNYYKITFSGIGFDKTRERAIVHIYVDLPGWVYTEYIYLEKNDEDWKYKVSKVDYRHSLY